MARIFTDTGRRTVLLFEKIRLVPVISLRLRSVCLVGGRPTSADQCPETRYSFGAARQVAAHTP